MGGRADVEDPRVDLCIFCLPPHRLRPIDLRCAPVTPVHLPRLTRFDVLRGGMCVCMDWVHDVYEQPPGLPP